MKTQKTILLLILSVLLFSCHQVEKQPNILFIMADDCSYNEIGCFGGLNAKTPNIDKLATEGLKLNRGYVSMSMCVPCRAELYTGLYPLESGVAWNHSQAKDGVKSIFHYLPELGYRVGLTGKTHIKPAEVYPYEPVDGFPSNCIMEDEPEISYAGIKAFIERDHKQPFCLFVCSTSPHAPWREGDASVYPPETLKIPASLGDTKEVREAYSRYLAEITYFDWQVGEILKTLEESGQAENTLVMLSTEQGWQFAGGKWTNWDLGVHTGIIAKWPNVISPNTETEALVQYADITPTFIDIAGGALNSNLSGSSFLDVLLGEKDEHRDYVYCMHNNIPEGKPYPIRSVISKDYHYINNLTSDSSYFEKHLEAGAHAEVWWDKWKEAESDREQWLVNRFYNRPSEELYAIKDDPHQFNNLASLPQYSEVKAKLKKELQNWMESENDPGIPVDRQIAFDKKSWYNK